MKPILTITGSDSTAGSGVQADIKTISELGGYAMSAITSITVQTTLGIQQFYDVPATIVAGQIDAVMNDFEPEVVKIGLIRREDTLEVVVKALQKYHPHHVILDTVVLSSRGDTLISHEMMEAISLRLLPLCTLVIHKNDGSMHGLSNRYASAVSVFLSQGLSAEEAESKAKAYISTQVMRASDLQGRSSELYNELLDAIAEHHHEASDVHFYADLLNVSSRYLAQVTRRISGKSPKAIIDDFLIHEIELQLKSTDNTVQEVAYHFGFSSQAHFTKFFKKLKGISPTEYRKLKYDNYETRQTKT
ncbi:MAG: bifunctional hydroxymethylpyrimidine kinase/phosphomethylpyrimidine kinase [Bacteroidaceae bacterium]|nr:bifunctional hydroxymethylpyrimidine kinase/phosphomethylpyrimidine kinase [Bacteroidaceae bacterium]